MINSLLELEVHVLVIQDILIQEASKLVNYVIIRVKLVLSEMQIINATQVQFQILHIIDKINRLIHLEMVHVPVMQNILMTALLKFAKIVIIHVRRV